jgi:hypothetical protein
MTNVSYDNILYGAARGNHLDLCELARGWANSEKIPIKYSWMVTGAAGKGNRDLCEYACKLMREMNPSENICFAILDGAIPYYPEICELARDLDSMDYNYMIARAASYGSASICKLAHDWCVKSGRAFDADFMVHEAIKYGSLKICNLALEYGVKDLKKASKRASKCMNSEISAAISSRLALETDTTKPSLVTAIYNTMIRTASKAGNYDTSKIMYACSATNADELLRRATLAGNMSLCLLAREYGAIDFNGMFAAAASCGDRILCETAVQWGAKRISS